MKGQHELPLLNFKRFAEEHGERKKKMKVSWAEYIKILNSEKEISK